MAENEKTSKTVASIAAKILEMNNPIWITDEFWKEMQSVAASALTQAPDNKSKFDIVKAYKSMKSQNNQAQITGVDPAFFAAAYSVFNKDKS